MLQQHATVYLGVWIASKRNSGGVRYGLRREALAPLAGFPQDLWKDYGSKEIPRGYALDWVERIFRAYAADPCVVVGWDTLPSR